jgi:hypothetical protein
MEIVMSRTNATLSLRIALIVAVFLASPRRADAQVLTLQFHEGVVSLHAENVLTRDILREWTMIGGATVLNADRLPETPVTIHLDNVTETAALATVLRDASGYIAVRRTSGPGASTLERIVIAPSATPIHPDVRAAVSEQPPTSGLSLADIQAMIVSRGGVSATEAQTTAVAGATTTGQPPTASSASASTRSSGSNSFGVAPVSGRPGDIQRTPGTPTEPITVGASPSGRTKDAKEKDEPAN